MNLNINFSAYSEILTDRLILRFLTPSDNQSIFAIRSNPKIAKHLDRSLYNSITEADNFITKISNGITNNEWLYWGLCLPVNNEVIGTICLWQFDGNFTSADIGYELIPKFQGKGYIQEAITAVINFAFTELKLKSLSAEVAMDNIKSVRILKKFGFNYVYDEADNTQIYELQNNNFEL